MLALSNKPIAPVELFLQAAEHAGRIAGLQKPILGGQAHIAFYGGDAAVDFTSGPPFAAVEQKNGYVNFTLSNEFFSDVLCKSMRLPPFAVKESWTEEFLFSPGVYAALHLSGRHCTALSPPQKDAVAALLSLPLIGENESIAHRVVTQVLAAFEGQQAEQVSRLLAAVCVAAI